MKLRLYSLLSIIYGEKLMAGGKYKKYILIIEREREMKREKR